jgi:hypothetical protein
MRAASFHVFVNEDSAFLGYKAAWLGNRHPTFRRKATPALSRVKRTEKNLSDLLNLDGIVTSSFETSGVENQVMLRHIPKPLSLQIQDSHVHTMLPSTCHQTPHNSISILFHLYKNKITGNTFILCFFPCICLPRITKGIQTDIHVNTEFVFCLFTENRKLEEMQHLFCFFQFLNPQTCVSQTRSKRLIYPYVQRYLEAIVKS